jgi:hypothetical protein
MRFVYTLVTSDDERKKRSVGTEIKEVHKETVL